MKTKKAFTLTELLIVIGIIGLLGVLITAYLRSQVFKANDARRKAEIKRIGIAVEEYEKDNDCYPTTVTCTANTSLRPYLDSIPCDPVSKSPYYYEHDGTSCPKWYRLYADLENEKDNDYQAGIGLDSAYSYYQSSPNAPALELTPPVGGDAFYGCFSGVCTPISGPEACPNYNVSNRDDCYGNCGTPSSPSNECIP
ncbi:MAG: hypothetical protein ACD_19C00176G0063 [uncultured bacterium]|nr:MAG: hypothetical protein ACD_19C00176G0063 [uncultured bacterium]